MLYLDVHGENVLIAWFANHNPSFDDVDLVEEVLETYARGDPIGSRWYTTRNQVTDDLVVMPREGLMLVIRRFSDDDPEHMFTLIAIEPTDHREDDGLGDDR